MSPPSGSNTSHCVGAPTVGVFLYLGMLQLTILVHWEGSTDGHTYHNFGLESPVEHTMLDSDIPLEGVGSSLGLVFWSPWGRN